MFIDGPARFSAGTLEIAKLAHLVVQPTGASLDDLRPAVREFHGLVNEGISKEKLVFSMCRIGTPTEETETRAYLVEAGYTVLQGCMMERPAYRKAQNQGHSVTETRFSSLNAQADRLIQGLIDIIGENHGRSVETETSEQFRRTAAS